MFCYQLVSGVATTLVVELEDTRKATYKYLSDTMGKYVQLLSQKAKSWPLSAFMPTMIPWKGYSQCLLIFSAVVDI